MVARAAKNRLMRPDSTTPPAAIDTMSSRFRPLSTPPLAWDMAVISTASRANCR